MRSVKAKAPKGRLLATHEEARLLCDPNRKLTDAELLALVRWRAVQLAEARLTAPILKAVTACLTERLAKSRSLSGLLNLHALEFNYISYSYFEALTSLGPVAGERLRSAVRVTHAACLRALGDAGALQIEHAAALDLLEACESREVTIQTQLRTGAKK